MFNNFRCDFLCLPKKQKQNRPLVTFIDPYEQKLFHLFSNHENGSGYIDVNGLNDLIQTLQLKERGSVLINLLLENGSRSRVTFKEFREGLLQVITSDDGNELLMMTFLSPFVVNNVALGWYWWWSI